METPPPAPPPCFTLPALREWLFFQWKLEPPLFEPPPSLTIPELLHFYREGQAAVDELIEMMELGGDIRGIWRAPRKYFVAEIGTGIPWPNDRAWEGAEAVQKMRMPADPFARSLAEDILFNPQWGQFARKEYIPERFH